MNTLRRDALAVLDAGLAAIRPGDAVKRACRLNGDVLTVDGKRFPLKRYRRIS